jgi:hypothetical protein
MKTLTKIQNREGEFGNIWSLRNGNTIEQTLELNNLNRFNLPTTESRLVTVGYEVETIGGRIQNFTVRLWGTAAKAKAAAVKFAAV